MYASHEMNTEKSHAPARDDFPKAGVATSTRASTLGERGRRRLPRPGWSTSSLERAADQTPAELAALATQLSNCNDSRGRFFRARSAVDAANGFARARFISTLVLVLVLVAVALVTTALLF